MAGCGRWDVGGGWGLEKVTLAFILLTWTYLLVATHAKICHALKDGAPCCMSKYGTVGRQFQLRATWVGVIFMLVAALYALTSPLWGWLSDKKGIKYPFIIGGNFATGVAFLLIGPSPLLPFLHTELWLVIFSLVFMGLTVGGTIIPTITCIMQEARQLNLGDGLELFGVVSGLFNSVFHMGAFLGPTIGSAVMENFGYSWSATLTSGFMFVTGLSVLLYLAVCKCLQCNRGHVRDVEKASLVTLSSQDEARRPTSGAQSHSQL